MDNHIAVTPAVLDEFGKATSSSDGLTAARILAEVGSCGWKSLMAAANPNANDLRAGEKVVADVVRMPDRETIRLFSVNNYRSVPLAQVTDSLCSTDKP